MATEGHPIDCIETYLDDPVLPADFIKASGGVMEYWHHIENIKPKLSWMRSDFCSAPGMWTWGSFIFQCRTHLVSGPAQGQPLTAPHVIQGRHGSQLMGRHPTHARDHGYHENSGEAHQVEGSLLCWMWIWFWLQGWLHRAWCWIQQWVNT